MDPFGEHGPAGPLPLRHRAAAFPHRSRRLYLGGAGYSGPAVYKTVNGGTDWTPLGIGLPSTLVFGLAFDNAIAQNLYAAAEAGPFRFDSGSGTWEDLSATSCCPPLTTYWDIESLGDYGIVRYATYGRGIWDFATGSTVGAPGSQPRADRVRLAVYPNPTRTRSMLEFEIAQAGRVRLEVYDIQGHRLATPLDAWRPAGRGQASFGTRLASGRVLESGVYLVRLTTVRGVEVSKLLIAR